MRALLVAAREFLNLQEIIVKGIYKKTSGIAIAMPDADLRGNFDVESVKLAVCGVPYWQIQ